MQHAERKMDARNQVTKNGRADEKQLNRLKKSVSQWNTWRKRYPSRSILLEGANLWTCTAKVESYLLT